MNDIKKPLADKHDTVRGHDGMVVRSEKLIYSPTLSAGSLAGLHMLLHEQADTLEHGKD